MEYESYEAFKHFFWLGQIVVVAVDFYGQPRHFTAVFVDCKRLDDAHHCGVCLVGRGGVGASKKKSRDATPVLPTFAPNRLGFELALVERHEQPIDRVESRHAPDGQQF